MSWVEGRGSWVWVWVNVVGKKSIEKMSVAKCHGSWVVGKVRGSWVVGVGKCSG